jgi:hypothetical protein
LGSKGIKWNFTKFLVWRDGRVIKRDAPHAMGMPARWPVLFRPAFGVHGPVQAQATFAQSKPKPLCPDTP